MLHVLVIDDQKVLLDSTRRFLERFGEMTVDTALSAKEALGILAQQTFDAIIVDYDMPEINGIEFLKIIRAKGDTTPVILFTAVGREHAAIEALNNGADFFLKKGDDPQSQLRDMVHMIKRSVERRSLGTGLGVSQKVLADTISFFSDPAFAIDREGKVIAWNAGMEQLTAVPPAGMIGKGDREYALPFFGRKAPLLIDLVFEDAATIQKYKYVLTGKEGSTLTGWTKVTGKDGKDAVIWMKAMPLYDAKGAFIGAVSAVRDITDTMGEELLKQQEAAGAVSAGLAGISSPGGAPAAEGGAGLITKLMGRGKAFAREGIRLYYREGKYAEAIEQFDKALEVDPTMAFAWNDRGICCRELGRLDEAIKNLDRALQLEPENEEILYNLAETLKKVGVLRGDKNAMEVAVAAYNKVLAINPNHADAWNNLGVCMREMGRDELSRQYFDRAHDLRIFSKDYKRVRNLDAMV